MELGDGLRLDAALAAANRPGGPASCEYCCTPLRTGTFLGDSDEDDDQNIHAEVWLPSPGIHAHAGLTGFGLRDGYGYPLSYATMLREHTLLEQHFRCDTAEPAEGVAPCPCQYHPVLIEELELARHHMRRWPGPVCRTCWNSRCSSCDNTFTSTSLAAGLDPESHRWVCHECAGEDAFSDAGAPQGAAP